MESIRHHDLVRALNHYAILPLKMEKSFTKLENIKFLKPPFKTMYRNFIYGW